MEIPDRFWKVEYNLDHYPGAPETDGLKGGANCQQFAYEILRHFGRHVSDLRSSDLWEDSVDTYHVSALEPLDLLLFHSRENPWGAHVAVYISMGKAIHLSRKLGVPAIWTVQQFLEKPEYRIYIGAKRTRTERMTTPVYPK
ncbi:MAG: cell wall hydrolase [Verrucomicrobia bacterium]|nr:cell wall hydrolase [Verrucomicrobiota bacterium]